MDFHPILLITFSVTILILLLIDLGIFSKNKKPLSTKTALIWVLVWISLSMAFSALVWYDMGFKSFIEYQSAYWIEESLSIDNLFVFILVFKQFKIPKEFQHRVLFLGIIGAIVFRAIFIFVGIELVKMTYLEPFDLGIFKNIEVNLILLFFGAFLLFAGINSLKENEKKDLDDENFKEGRLIRWINKKFRTTKEFDGNKFFTVKNGVRYATPLFIALVIIEFSDLLFAMDSIPAIFSVSQDPVILYTSNIFAILGLRSLYFVLSGFMDKFKFLKYSISAILIFIGIKMLIAPIYHLKPTISLFVIFSLLAIGVISSYRFNKKTS